MKKKTCFHYGTPGRIARNCPNRAYVPYYAQGWQNAPIGRYSKRNPSRSRLDHDDWNPQNAKNSTPKAKNQTSKDKNQNPKGNKGMSAKKSKPRDASVKSKSKSSQRPTSRSKASTEPPIRSKKKWVKPNYNGFRRLNLPNLLMILIFIYLLFVINRICHGRMYRARMTKVDPVSKWIGFQRPTDPALCRSSYGGISSDFGLLVVADPGT